jgi:serine/threonine protein kinase
MNKDPRIEELLLRWEEQRQQGDPQSVAQLCADCPELLPDVQERLRTLLRWEEFLDAGRPAQVERPPDVVGATMEETAPEPALPYAEHVAVGVPVERRIGPYRPQKLLGTGSFGEVWLAIREGGIANTRLAIKLPRAPGTDLESIRREAGLWALASNHPNVVPVFEANVYDGRVVIASEFCEDGSLADFLKQQAGTDLSPTKALDLVLGILAGLEHLHGLGIVHRDIKPANVLLHKGVPRLADFGLSRFLTQEASTDVPAGTPAYMAPEAFDGVRSQATDIWSVGVLCHQLLAGSLPFTGPDWATLFASIGRRDPEPLPDRVPESIRGIVRMALEKDAARRPPSATRMAEMIRQAAGGLGTAAHPVKVATHFAYFSESRRPALFINVANLSSTLDREVTHIWLDVEEPVHVVNQLRPLPKRLRPQESWETWIEFWQLPLAWLAAPTFDRVRVRLSTGEVIFAVRNTNVPAQGFIPGDSTTNSGAATPTLPASGSPAIPAGEAAPAPRARPWWRFW